MSDQILAPEQCVSLTHERWTEVHEQAKQGIRNLETMPALAHYLRASAEEFPAWLTRLTAVVLGVLAMGALFVSAGKQLAAADIVLSNVALHSERVNGLWVSVSLIVLLLVGEIGALAFGIAGGVFGRTKSSRMVFRVFMFASALVALLANVSMTYVHRVPDLELFQWFVTVFAPSIVLGVGLVGENILMAHLERRAEAVRKWQVAMERYQTSQITPEKHEAWSKTLAAHVLQAVRTAQPARLRKTFDETLHADPSFRQKVVLRELQLHMSEYDAVDLFLARPTLPLPTTHNG